MTKNLFLMLLACIFSFNASAKDVENVKEVKNVILMIPDGCSLATISTARWYQWCKDSEKPNLAIDPYICGVVRTTCSNAPIGDSAPTTSCYMTGYNSLAGWVSTYPTSSNENDIYPMDSTRAYQPLATVLEAARMLKGKATGLVSTCYFPHATPADCSSHSYNRNKYDDIASQQVHNALDVVMGGGGKYITDAHKQYLTSKGYTVISKDVNAMRSCSNNKMWAQFTSGDMTNDMERDNSKEPSIAEMTEVAIKKLSANPNGFFLMVEGSKVDYSAHANDPVGMVTEYLAFDKACAVALEYAKKMGNTAVVILADHGNSGISIGRRDWGSYSRDSKQKVFGALCNYKATADEMAAKVNRTPFENVQSVFKEWLGFELNEKELEALKYNREYKQSPIPEQERKEHKSTLYSSGLVRMIGQFMTERTGLAFTTNGHTGEDVILSAYHPESSSLPVGMHTNMEINHYLCNLNGITHDNLDQLTSEIFAKHTEVFSGLKYTIENRVLTVKKGKKTLHITPNTNIVSLNGEDIELNSVIVYVDKNNTFYLPQSLRNLLNK